MEHNTFWCEHPQTRLVYKTCSNGAIFYYQQCVQCFEQVTDWISKKSLGNKILSALDENQDGNGLVYPKTESEWKRHNDMIKRQGNGKYQNYLKSKEWERISQRCLQRDRNICQVKLTGCTGRATQAHHLTYANVYKEKLEDLLSVCPSCHDRITRERIDLRYWRTLE